MSGHRILADAALAPFEAVDPGDAGTLVLNRDRAVFALTVGAAGETRIIAQPTKAGLEAVVNIAYTAGGSVTLTVTGTYDGSGSSLTLDGAGDWVKLLSVATSATAYQWRLVQGGSGSNPAGGSIPGLTATVAELNYVDVTPGTAAASKAVVLNSASHIDALKTTALYIGASGAATQVTATAAELNYCDVTTLGTAQASKAVTSDASLDTTGVRNLSCTGTVQAEQLTSTDDATVANTLTVGANGASGTAGEIVVNDGANPGSTITLSYADLAKLDGITNGTQAAGKCVVADNNVNIGIVKATALHIGATGAETEVTATGAELNYCDVTTLGTAQASKAVTADASIDVTGIRNLTCTGTITGGSYTTSTDHVIAGASGTAGDVAIFPATGSKGKTLFTCTDNDGDTTTTVTTAAQTGVRTYTVPDAGASASFVMTAGAQLVGGAKTLTEGASAAAVALRFGAVATEGLEIKVIDETVNLTNAVETNLTETVPSGAVILSVQANNQTTVVGDASGDDGLVKVGVGTTADPDKYGKTGDLVKNTKIDTIPDWAVLSGAETVTVKGCDAGGAAVTEKFVADNPAGTRNQVRVRIVYAVPNSLADAA